jgi:RimJ/RimL family protein N-acetyltransferase
VEKDRAPHRAEPAERDLLVDALGDSPETVISVHLLAQGLCDAYVAGDPEHFRGLIVHSHQDRGEPIAFGANAQALWELLKMARGWWCVNISEACAPRLGSIVVKETGRAVRYYADVHHTLTRPTVPFEHEAVRLLTFADLAMLDSAAAEVRGGFGWASGEHMLEEGIVAGTVIEGRLVAIAYTSAHSRKHADIGVTTLKQWRSLGLATAAATLVARQVQERRQVPVWSCGEDNYASLRVAHKLGFAEVLRRVYVIPQGW